MGPAGGESAEQQRPAPQPFPDEPTLAGTPAPAQGWGEHIAWRHLDEGLKLASAHERPLMLVVHASWCAQCKRLKPAFHDQALGELTRHFVMVNADQDLVPDVLQYGPDGRYLPRVVFIAPDTGEVDITLTNPRRRKERHFFGPRDDLVGTMKRALARHGKS